MINLEFSLKNNKLPGMVESPRKEDKDSSTPSTLDRPLSSVLPVSPPPIPKRLIKTALHQAVLDGRLHQVRLLVIKHGVNVDVKDVYGRTPLMLTSMVDEEAGAKMARILINSGASLNLRDNMGRSALSLACMHGRELIVDEILAGDILNINEQDNDGSTPLHHAATSGNPNIVHLLVDFFVKFGLDVDTRNNLGYTALLLACRNGHFVSAYYLLSKGCASPSLRDGETYLNAAEWTQKSSRNTQLSFRRLLTTSSAPAFSRESTMYQRAFTPICKHTSRQNTLYLSWPREDLALQRSETFIDGKDARQLVMKLISDQEEQSRPVSTKSIRTRPHPPTAKLLALSRNRRTRSALPTDMTTLFKIYSDQYQPDWRRERTSIALLTPKDSKIPAIIRTPSDVQPMTEIAN